MPARSLALVASSAGAPTATASSVTAPPPTATTRSRSHPYRGDRSAVGSTDDFLPTHSCALTSAGALTCWGPNVHGQLGNGSTTDSTRPVEVSGLSSGIVAVAVGGSHTCAITDAKRLKCRGDNSNGQLGWLVE